MLVLRLGALLVVAVATAATPSPAAVAGEEPELRFVADFSGMQGAPPGPPRVVATDAVTQGDHLVLRNPAASAVEVRFLLPVPPTAGTMELVHLSSSSKGAARDGSSLLRVDVNDATVVRDWDVGGHVFATDRLEVGKFLGAGENVVRLRFTGGATAYWLRRIEVRCAFPPGTALDGKVERTGRREGADYAVVVGRATYGDPAWRKVADALVAKHDAALLVCPASVLEARAGLAALRPRHACFVARPEELGRRVVVSLNRMTRRLDDDPYGDVSWGVVTGYDAADALRVAERREPLLLRRAAAGTGIDLDRFESGAWFSEGEKNVRWEKRPGAPAERGRCADDATAEIVAELDDGKPDLFVTSGHATERDWQIGYSFRSGQLRCEGGRLLGIDLAGKRHPIESPNPKVYLAAGNCRMGLVYDRDAMALAWMRSAGAVQVVGYAGSSLFGSTGGFGTLDYLVAGGLPLADALFASRQWMVHQLETRFPRSAQVEFQDYDVENDPRLVDALAERYGITERDELLYLWDRDLLVLYGDPAWSARIAAPRPPVEVSILEKDGLFTVEATAAAEGGWSREAFAWLPRRVKDPRVVEGDVLVTDDFLLLPLPPKMAKGAKVRAVFTGTER